VSLKHPKSGEGERYDVRWEGIREEKRESHCKEEKPVVAFGSEVAIRKQSPWLCAIIVCMMSFAV
jgi:hypothetical protein